VIAQISLKDLEKNVYQLSVQDGLIDLQIGVFLLTFAIIPLLSTTLGDFWSSMVFLPIWSLLYFGVREIRKKVIQPRIGAVEFGTYRKTRQKKFNLIILIFNLLALLLGILSFINLFDLPGWAISVRFSVIILGGFSLAGYMMEFPRLYLYGVITALAPIIGEYLFTNFHVSHHGIPITFGTISPIIILVGLVIFLRLLKQYPVTEPEEME